jgi:hypothetical protein
VSHTSSCSDQHATCGGARSSSLAEHSYGKSDEMMPAEPEEVTIGTIQNCERDQIAGRSQSIDRRKECPVSSPTAQNVESNMLRPERRSFASRI